MKLGQTPAYKESKLFAKAIFKDALIQFLSTVTLYGLTIRLMYLSLSYHYFLTLVISLFAVALYLRLFMIGHDCGHGSFMPKRWQNRLVANVVGPLTNTPIAQWARQHSVHHQTTGNLDNRGFGDVPTKTTDEYEKCSFIEKTHYKIMRNPFFLFLIAAPIHFVIIQRLPQVNQLNNFKTMRSIMMMNVAIVIYYGTLIQVMGLMPFLLIFVPIVMMSSTVAVWLFYVQHQFEDAYWERKEKWTYHDATLQGSSFYDLPLWLHWATGNIGYHHIHHLNPNIPNYRLQACFDSGKTLQITETNRLTFSESLSTAWLTLWDERNHRLVSFAEHEKSNVITAVKT